MQVFVAFNISAPDVVQSRIEQHYPGNSYRASTDSFFVATDGETTREVGENLGFGDEENLTSGIIIPVTSYWGRYRKELWEWISVKLDANGK